ncbi:MAG: thioredoxin family protein [Candidatus Eisenbacteria bacterium]|uniref:Thioredoxin family protein n=1 Tax=Eiseniibacteriota bacterium TaxID=2212470 RepID=A0A956RP84_UNCEI|nr:thioredoxin family protein [Candidatus Eisenbacteria bacterium]
MSRRFGLVGAFVAALSLSLPTSAVWAAGDEAEGWDETAGVQLMVGEALDPGASIFDSPDYQHTLVVPSEGDAAYLLALKTQSVTAIPRTAIAWDEEHRPLPDVSAGEELGLFINNEGVMTFDGEVESYHVQPEPPLVGDISFEKLLEAKPDYVIASKKYTPDAAAVAALSKVATETQIEVFFGSWCSHCKHWVPPLIRVVEDASNPHFHISVHAMSEDQSQPADSIRKYDVSKTPTIVVVQNGQELGRIEEEPLISMEADLVRMLKAK